MQGLIASFLELEEGGASAIRVRYFSSLYFHQMKLLDLQHDLL